MPELPDVEGFRRYFNRYAADTRIVSVEVRDPKMLRGVSARAFEGSLKGRRFGRAGRHGKWLMAPAGEATVLVHFGMTGLLHYTSADAAPHRHDRVVFKLDGGTLAYRNMRRFGAVGLGADDASIAKVTGPLGPDALGLTEAELGELLGSRRGALKPALMDQALIAGLGNLLVDETLWRARLHPRRDARPQPATLRRLHAAMQGVLRESLPHARIPRLEGWLTGVRDERGARCPRCGTRLRRGQVGGRTTVWCSREQRAA